MNDPEPTLARLSRLARQRPGLLAHLLSAYQEAEGLDDAGLAVFLECEIQALPRLALCRLPRAAPYFRADIEKIAAYAQANPRRLATLLRAAEARQALRRAPGSTAPMLLAARDRDDSGEGDTSAEEQPPDGE